MHTPLLTPLHFCLLPACNSPGETLECRETFTFNSLLRLNPKKYLNFTAEVSFFLMGRGKLVSRKEKVFFFTLHFSQASTFPPLYCFQRLSVRFVQICSCCFPRSLSPLPCALSLYHHIFPWQINFTHDQPTPLAALGPAVIKRREITIYIILMQTSFSR